MYQRDVTRRRKKGSLICNRTSMFFCLDSVQIDLVVNDLIDFEIQLNPNENVSGYLF